MRLSLSLTSLYALVSESPSVPPPSLYALVSLSLSLSLSISLFRHPSVPPPRRPGRMTTTAWVAWSSTIRSRRARSSRRSANAMCLRRSAWSSPRHPRAHYTCLRLCAARVAYVARFTCLRLCAARVPCDRPSSRALWSTRPACQTPSEASGSTTPSTALNGAKQSRDTTRYLSIYIYIYMSIHIYIYYIYIYI
jgi:hypothetical protein